ncbi:hypothetical protein [Streptomyces canus]|uniref:hypothetical protein n=1 Tax=Streptomyces canus TaxID=58343 RepID=UPI00380A9731
MTQRTVDLTSNGTGVLDATPTAPLPTAAAKALAKLERAFLPLDLVRAVTRYEIATERRAGLEAKPTREWSGADFSSFADCERVLIESAMMLAVKGRMDLIDGIITPVIRAVVDYRRAALRAANLGNEALFSGMPTMHADDLAHAEDLKLGARATLAEAGRLDLVGRA